MLFLHVRLKSLLISIGLATDAALELLLLLLESTINLEVSLSIVFFHCGRADRNI